MDNYCLLCDKVLENKPYIQHKYHRYGEYFMEYYLTKDAESYSRTSELIVTIYGYPGKDTTSDLHISKEQFMLFKGMHNWELAKSIIDKLRVFK